MKTALIHHWLVTLRGGERVLETVAELFPSADLFALVCDRSRIPACLAQHRIQSSFLQALPNATSWYRYDLPLFPLATKQLDVAGYDLTPASVLTKPPSAELAPGQRDDQNLPPYELLDPVLEAYVERDMTRAIEVA